MHILKYTWIYKLSQVRIQKIFLCALSGQKLSLKNNFNEDTYPLWYYIDSKHFQSRKLNRHLCCGWISSFQNICGTVEWLRLAVTVSCTCHLGSKNWGCSTNNLCTLTGELISASPKFVWFALTTPGPLISRMICVELIYSSTQWC